MNDGDYNWSDFFPGEQAVATVDGKVLGVPGARRQPRGRLQQGPVRSRPACPSRRRDWTWDDLRAAAKAITDPANKVFGLVFPVDGSETTVWQYEAMLWAAGGDILNSDNTEAAFNSAAGVRALTTLTEIQQDGSMYLDFQPDSGKSGQLFNSGNIGMIITGPVGPVRVPGRELRRPGHAVVRPGRQPPDDRRARTTG